MQVIEIGGRAATTPIWQDVVNIPARSRIRVRIAFDDFAGTAVSKCLTLDHEDNGRMGVISVTSISGCGAKTKRDRADTFVHQEIVTEPFSIFCPLPIRYFAVTSNSVEVRGTVLFL